MIKSNITEKCYTGMRTMWQIEKMNLELAKDCDNFWHICDLSRMNLLNFYVIFFFIKLHHISFNFLV